MSKIGIISDSHHRGDVARNAICVLKDFGAQLLIHAGDIVLFDTLVALRDSGLLYVAVLGNNDDELAKFKDEFSLFNQPYDFRFSGLKIRVMHHPFYISSEFDLNIYGHTHYFAAARAKNGSVVINPGEICARKKNKFEFCMAEFNNKECEITKFESNTDTIQWKSERFKI